MLVQRGDEVQADYDSICEELDLATNRANRHDNYGVSLTARQVERLIKALQRGLAKFPRRKSRRKKA